MGSVRKRVSKVINAITKAVRESLFINSNSITFEFLNLKTKWYALKMGHSAGT